MSLGIDIILASFVFLSKLASIMVSDLVPSNPTNKTIIRLPSFMAFSKGVKVGQNNETGVYVCDIHSSDYIFVRVLNFGKKSPRTFTAQVASALQGGIIEVHVDKPDGALLCTVNVPHTGDWEEWQTVKTKLSRKIEGVHDLYFLFKGNQDSKLFNFDWWKFQ